MLGASQNIVFFVCFVFTSSFLYALFLPGTFVFLISSVCPAHLSSFFPQNPVQSVYKVTFVKTVFIKSDFSL